MLRRRLRRRVPPDVLRGRRRLRPRQSAEAVRRSRAMHDATARACAAARRADAPAETGAGDYTAGGLYAPGVADSAPTTSPDVDRDAASPCRATSRARATATARRTPCSGKNYHVLRQPRRATSSAASPRTTAQKFHGRRTSNLEVYDMYAFTAAHKTLPLPSFARVTNLDNGKRRGARQRPRPVPRRPRHRPELRRGGASSASPHAAPAGRSARADPGRADAPRAAPSPRTASARRRRRDRRSRRSAAAGPLAPACASLACRSRSFGDTRQCASAWPQRLRRRRRRRGATVESRRNVRGDRDLCARARPARVRRRDRRRPTRRRAGRPCALRVGPAQAAQAAELAARIAGLGFGQPQRVRD